MDIISFLSDRISQAYAEQIWTVATLGVYYGFIIKYHDKIIEFIKSFKFKKTIKLIFIIVGIWVFAAIGIGFIISRHYIFEHYNDYLKQELIKNGYRSLVELPYPWDIGQSIANYSGVALYSLIILILAFIAFFSLKKPKTGSTK
jgi:hypothetical protein